MVKIEPVEWAKAGCCVVVGGVALAGSVSTSEGLYEQCVAMLSGETPKVVKAKADQPHAPEDRGRANRLDEPVREVTSGGAQRYQRG